MKPNRAFSGIGTLVVLAWLGTATTAAAQHAVPRGDSNGSGGSRSGGTASGGGGGSASGGSGGAQTGGQHPPAGGHQRPAGEAPPPSGRASAGGASDSGTRAGDRHDDNRDGAGNRDGREGEVQDHAVRRIGPAPRNVGRTVIVPRGYYAGGYPFGWGGLGFGYYGGFYDPWFWDPWYVGYPVGAFHSSAFDGALRLKIKPRDAEVYVDGYYAGVVDEFDGVFQKLHIDPGPHRIEVRAPGYDPLSFEVRILPDRTITYTGELRKEP